MKIRVSPGKIQSKYFEVLNEIKDNKVIERIWEKDFTVWSDKPDEITNRLGWLKVTEFSSKFVSEIEELSDELKQKGITDILLMGMGGSSLAPEVFSKILSKPGFPNLHMLDSTHPDEIKKYSSKLDPVKTFYIVSTKSGGTIETLSFLKYFYVSAAQVLGNENVSQHFGAITDPSSGLQKLAEKLNFRKIFINDPDIGGRFSALSLFGMVPAILCGVDGANFLSNVKLDVYKSSSSNSDFVKSASLISAAAVNGQDKLTFMLSDKFFPLGAWAEQLIAESTGKIGKGVLPVIEDEILPLEKITDDRMIVVINTENDGSFDEYLNTLENSAVPFVNFVIEDSNELASQFFIWEMITSVLGWKLNIHPFDQPDVESAKVAAREFISEFNETGKLPEVTVDDSSENLKVISGGKFKLDNIKLFNENFVDGKGLDGRSYVSLQAYVPYDNDWTESLELLKKKYSEKLNCAATLGYGPRFLHSTGQLHKGDAGKGLFIQIFTDPVDDITIPELDGSEAVLTFGNLVKAQSLGDRQALINNERNIIRFDCVGKASDCINEIISVLDLE